MNDSIAKTKNISNLNIPFINLKFSDYEKVLFDINSVDNV